MDVKLIREYNFEIEDAIAFGVDEAIMLKNIKFWIAKNQVNNKHFYDGKYWTFNSANAFTELFPFWTQKQIRRIIKSLIDQEVLIIGNYNKTPYDRTRWYTINISMLPKENYDVPKWENGNDDMVTPIPYINTDNKTNKKTNNNIKELPKKEFKVYGEFKNVKLTDEQINKLKGIYNNYLEEAIEIVSSYVQSSGKKYKDFYAVLGKHNWVYKEIIKRINEKKKTQREFY